MMKCLELRAEPSRLRPAKANDALSRSISPILVQYKSVEKWNGTLPQVSGGAVPFIDLGKMGGLSGGTEGSKR